MKINIPNSYLFVIFIFLSNCLGNYKNSQSQTKKYTFHWIGSFMIYKISEFDCNKLSDNETSVLFKYEIINHSNDTLYLHSDYSFYIVLEKGDSLQINQNENVKHKVFPKDTLIQYTYYENKPWHLNYTVFREYYTRIFKSAKLIYKPKNIDSLKIFYKNISPLLVF
jgi:hypothetical protein